MLYIYLSLAEPVPALVEREMMTLRDFPAIIWGEHLLEVMLSSQSVLVPLLLFSPLFTGGLQLELAGRPIDKHQGAYVTADVMVYLLMTSHRDWFIRQEHVLCDLSYDL